MKRILLFLLLFIAIAFPVHAEDVEDGDVLQIGDRQFIVLDKSKNLIVHASRFPDRRWHPANNAGGKHVYPSGWNCNELGTLANELNTTFLTGISESDRNKMANVYSGCKVGLLSGSQFKNYYNTNDMFRSIAGGTYFWTSDPSLFYRGEVYGLTEETAYAGYRSLPVITFNGDLSDYVYVPPPPPPPPKLERIEITPASVQLEEGEEAVFRAIAYYDSGTTVDITNVATWNISNMDNAIFVSSNQLNSLFASFYMTVYAADTGIKIKSVKHGSATITASHEGMTGIASLTISAPPTLKDKIRAFIDKIFNPIHAFLDLAIEKLQQAGTVTAQGLNVGQYLSIFGDMPRPWQLVIYSLMISLALIGSVFMFRSIMRLYFALKDGVKWW